MSRAELIRILAEASQEDREFVANFLAGLGHKQSARKEEPPEDDPFYRLHELALDDLKPLSNREMDAIIYGGD